MEDMPKSLTMNIEAVCSSEQSMPN